MVGRRNTLCLEQVGLLTRASEIGCLVLSDDIEVKRETLPMLGRGKVYTRRREIEETYHSIASQTQQHILQMIKQDDPNQESPMFGRVSFWGSLLGTAIEQELDSWCVRSTSS